MKRFLTTWLLALGAVAALNAQTMTENHQLTSLWKKYEAAHKADRPQTEAEILKQIKEEAAAQHLAVDFYDAASEYVNTVRRRDWKQKDKLVKDLEEEVKAFDEPIVTFRWMVDWEYASNDWLWSYAQEHEEGFQGCHRAFHKNVSEYLEGALPPFIRSDWEYVLWYLQKKKSAAREALEKEIEGIYPNHAALEYFLLTDRFWSKSDRNKEQEAFETLAGKYEGKAVSLFPRAQVLRIRMQALDDAKASSARYQELFQDAGKLEKERQSYKGSEATLAKACSYPSYLIQQLEEKSIGVSLDGSTIKVALQNLPKADVRLIKNGSHLRTWKLTNKVGSFYVKDTLTVEMPSLEDGDYLIEAVNGKLSDETHYTQYTLSIATRTDSRGECVYVTDYKTGVPLRSVTLRLMKGTSEAAKATLKLDGFTPLPAALQKVIRDHSDTYYSIEAESGKRKSRPVSLQSFYKGRIDDQIRCNLYRDRGAYNPGDTVKFKAVIFRGDPSHALEVIPGKEVQIVLRDSEGNVLETKNFTTNEHGSVSGSFAIPKGLRNGHFSLEVKGLYSSGFRVDEFVLPTFDLSFDHTEQLYLVGDRVDVSGKLISYSGHNLSGVKLRAKVRLSSRTVLEQDVAVNEDNTFCFKFPAKSQGFYSVTVTATDPGGETQSFDQGFYVGNELSVGASVEGVADSDLILANYEERYWRYYEPRYTLESPDVNLTLYARDGGGNRVPLPVKYTIFKAGMSDVISGEIPSGERLSLKLPGSGLYTVAMEASATNAEGKKFIGEGKIRLFVVTPEDRRFTSEVERFFIAGPTTLKEGEAITARMGSADGDAYAVVTLYGKDREVLMMTSLHSVNGAVENLNIPYQASWPDVVRLQVFYFINGKAVSYDRQFRREKDRYTLPLKFTRFVDKAYPGTRYTFSMETAPDAEVLAAAWDKSIDAVARNYWYTVNLREESVEGVYVSSIPGQVGNVSPAILYGSALRRTKAAGAVMLNAAVEEEAVLMSPMETADMAAMEDSKAISTEEADAQLADVKLRENFSAALTFQPHLRPGADGNLTFSLTTSDKLSTFYVRAYAHDKSMHNAIVEGEMVVSVPVKVSLLEPKFLYKGDVYEALVTVSSMADTPVEGMIVVQAGDRAQQVPVTVAPGATETRRFRLEVTPDTAGEIPLTAAFKTSDFSDGVKVNIPVYEAIQPLTEAHSAVLHAGEDRDALIRELRGRFVNVPGAEAVLKDITILDMVKDAIPSHVEPDGNDVLSLSEAWYIRLMVNHLDIPGLEKDEAGASELLRKVLACRNSDGGFGWFEGMTSSPVITAVLLERFAKLRDRGFREVPEVSSSVKYLDYVQFEESRPWWCGWISDAQYMYIRALYSEVPFEVDLATEAAKKRWKAFLKDAKSYLTPSAKEGRGLQGRILEKSRRLLTLRRLDGSTEGIALAKAWGVGITSKLESSIDADVLSLLEYAVEHRDGGWYYPNAVMPWRGLMESEAYAHALLCELMRWTSDIIVTQTKGGGAIPAPSEVADGIRIWLMLQKETQKWDTEPAYIDAVTAILDGSWKVKETHVLALSASYEAPFKEVKAAGNGFTIGRQFFRENGSPLVQGDTLRIGEKITVKYNIWNGENRSFVKVNAGREASLTPVQQLSGYIGYGFIRPFRSGYVFDFTPQGYRNVKAERTEYFFDSYPEEKTTLSEDFFVTRAGVFHAPAVTIESLYAPHYRANSEGPAPLLSE